MSVLQATILLLVAGGGTCVVATRDPLRQAMVASLFGILLAILFFVLQAPDVALSEIVVGAVALPLMILLSLAKIRGGQTVTVRVRRVVFLLAGATLAIMLLWGFGALPSFGSYHGPYGFVLNQVSVPERHITDVVTAVNFDYRGFDTLGEEFIFFAAVLGVALILRATARRSARPHRRLRDRAGRAADQ